MESIEKNILANLLASADNCKLFRDSNFSEVNFLYPEPRKFFQVLWHHYEHHKEVVAKDTFESYVRRSPRITDDYASKLVSLYEEIKLLPVASNFQVLLDEFLIYYKTTSLAASMSKATSLLHDKTPDKALNYLKAELQKLQNQTEGRALDSTLFGHKVDIVDLYQKKLLHPELFSGIGLGFPSMDNTITHTPGTVCLIMGQMKSAKSVLMVNIARNLLAQGKRIYYHVNEGGAALVQNRLVSCETGLYMSKIDRTKLSPEEYDIFEKCSNSIKQSGLLNIDDVPNSSSNADYIERTLIDLTEKFGKYDVVLVDYLGLMNTKQPTDSDWKKFGVITLELKDIAMKLNIPIIVICHVNRKGMQDKKNHFDLDEMGVSLEPLKHVDTIMSWRIHDPDLFEITNTGQGTLSIRGGRQSGQKTVVLDVDTNKMKIWENIRPITVASATASSGSTF